MLSPLRVCEIGAIILVYSEAETAFEGANMIFEEVGVFVEVDGFEREFSQSLSPVCIRAGIGCYAATTEF